LSRVLAALHREIRVAIDLAELPDVLALLFSRGLVIAVTAPAMEHHPT